MLKKYKKIWLRALRGKSPNGVYIKTYNQFTVRDEGGQDRFCAIGVLINETFGFSDDDCSMVTGIPEDTSELTPSEEDIFGFRFLNYDAYEISSMNDVDNLSFKEIADWIEEKL